ncbi:MAG: nuclear transport factor 2 family protein [Candidatus Binataceae bacterium]
MSLTGTLEDREQIRELYARYAHTVDHDQFPAWVKCFTEDGTFESPIFGKHSGPRGLLKFTALYKESMGGARVRHVMSNVLFEVDGERATGSCYLSYYHCKEGKVSLAALGRYDDRLRKINGEWLFESRQVTIDGHA